MTRRNFDRNLNALLRSSASRTIKIRSFFHSLFFSSTQLCATISADTLVESVPARASPQANNASLVHIECTSMYVTTFSAFPAAQCVCARVCPADRSFSWRLEAESCGIFGSTSIPLSNASLCPVQRIRIQNLLLKVCPPGDVGDAPGAGVRFRRVDRESVRLCTLASNRSALPSLLRLARAHRLAERLKC